jgi:ribosomal protein L40E
MAVQTRYCGRCGAPLVPGAVFCGRCGAAQLAPAAVTPVVASALAAPPLAPPAAYGYRVAQPGAFPQAGRAKVPQWMVIGGVLAILAIAVVTITGFALARSFGTHPTCTSNCGPQVIAPLPEAATYHSNGFGFEVDYNSTWKVRSQDANGISLGTAAGALTVVGSRAGPSTGQLIDSTVSALPSSKWQSVTKVTDLRGAHIGVQDGEGAVYSANLIGSGTTSTQVRFAVIAATRGATNVVIFAVDPAAPKDFTYGIPEGGEFDYLCQEFRWAS